MIYWICVEFLVVFERVLRFDIKQAIFKSWSSSLLVNLVCFKRNILPKRLIKMDCFGQGIESFFCYKQQWEGIGERCNSKGTHKLLRLAIYCFYSMIDVLLDVFGVLI